MALSPQPKSYQFYNNVSTTQNDFDLDAGWYAITQHATSYGTVCQLQRFMPDFTTYVNVGANITADGMENYILPAGQYRLLLTGVTGLVATIELISRGGAR